MRTTLALLAPLLTLLSSADAFVGVSPFPGKLVTTQASLQTLQSSGATCLRTRRPPPVVSLTMGTEQAREARKQGVDRILFRAEMMGMDKGEMEIKRILLKADLLMACEEFRLAQAKMWAEEAAVEEEKRARKKSKSKEDRVGGLFGAESLGTSVVELGVAGERTVEVAEQLMVLNPILNPLEGWGTSECKLGGTWKKLFTTAADATFKPGRRGNAKVGQIVDPVAGVLTNIIKFDGTANKVKEFRVKVAGSPSDKERQLDLDFKEVQIFRRSKLPRLFGAITIKLPSRRVLQTIAKWGSRGKAASNQAPMLEICYFDDDLWIHRTGEGNMFVQKRE
mmetsp:Transcript_33246/g.77769  ORF Transcript_33246/g.77769 Transcript_33246/m.77769 type:complete len:337 (-) Transcript_33246:200-1210(-)